ncbi:MAG: hypothetical protein KF729_08400 [Sandaracinaceae bacterium]|nr:hypothetical protein [Sandaracinaceae bacterium]
MAAPPSRRDLLIAALASLLIGCPPAVGPGDAGADAGADALDATSREGGAPPSPLDAGPEACPAGALRYTDAGACLPADPCRGDTSCAGAERICLGVDGVARCGRCLDGFAERDGACVEDPRLRERATRFRVGTDYFWVWSGTRYERLYVRGVNLGGSVPGTGPRGGAIGRARYDRWLAMMSEAGLDAVRVYSLHPPELYEALAAHNRARPDRPIYLLQGVSQVSCSSKDSGGLTETDRVRCKRPGTRPCRVWDRCCLHSHSTTRRRGRGTCSLRRHCKRPSCQRHRSDIRYWPTP